MTVNGVAQPPVAITRADGDLHRAIDLTGLVHAGDNTVQITMAGQGELSYHLARRVHVPRAVTPTSPELSLEVGYSGAEGLVGTPISTRVTASYRGAGARDQVIVRVGLAPGFVPRSETLEALDAALARPETVSPPGVPNARDPELAEAWATLGFVLERTGRPEDALAALERAVTLEPDNWRHQVRLALGSWGETRLRAARAALKRCPQLPLAHWLAATVFVARHALDQAERDVDLGLAVAGVESPEAAPYSTVALHWLKGLLRNAAGDTAAAMASFDRELAQEPRGHLYGREIAANAWYAKDSSVGVSCV